MYAFAAGDAVAKNELSSFTTSAGFDEALNKINMSWLSNIITVCEDIYDILDSMTDCPNYYNNLVYYYANGVDYNVYTILSNGTLVKMQDVRNELSDSN